jgi:hypothetical protein
MNKQNVTNVYDLMLYEPMHGREALVSVVIFISLCVAFYGLFMVYLAWSALAATIVFLFAVGWLKLLANASTYLLAVKK